MKKILPSLLLVLCGCSYLYAQTGSSATGTNYYDMSIEDLMNVKVSVASTRALTSRESPGIITLITEEEIINSGARDLMDILNTIPGFDFGVDVEGVVGLGVRGNWAHEGKFLLLLDGLEMNENLFSSTQFGNHYPIENVKQIEIIRGPGSAMYGGYAEYAVINIITRSASEVNGVRVNGNVSATANGLSGSRAAISLGRKFRDLSFTVSGFSGITGRSDHTYSDLYSGSYNMNRNSDLKNNYINSSIEYKKFKLRMIADNYSVTGRDYYTNITSGSYTERFNSVLLELKKDIFPVNKICLSPKMVYKKQLPWNFTGESFNEEESVFNIVSEKINPSFSANYDPSEKVSISAGIDYAYFKATDYTEGSGFKNGNDELSYTNTALFVQSLLRMGFADFTIGARYNYNSQFNPSFVPRIGITKVYKKFHFKCLYNSAFRTPGTENINYGINIQPEKTSVYEMEAGMELTEKMCLTLNAFSIRTTNTIVYYYDAFNDADAYKNYFGSGTQGFELVYKIKDRWGWLEINYAYYNAKNNIRTVNYEVPGHDNLLLGFPAHKINAKCSVKINSSLSLAPSATCTSSKFYNSGITDQGQSLVKRIPASCIANLYFNYKNFIIKNLQAGIGIYNILNNSQLYVQPYNSLHAPLPGQSREYAIKLLYELKY